MNPHITICIGTYGDKSWIEMAQRAIESAHDQAPVIHVHGDSLADARNSCLRQVETELVVFLDADDILEPGYADAMAAAHADVRVPIVRVIRDGKAKRLMFLNVWSHIHDCTGDCLPYGNWIVVGAAAYTALIREAGGFGDYGWSEDWALWGKCQSLGASFERVPEAIYRHHLNHDSRNHAGPGWEQRAYWHQRIGHDIWPDIYDDPGEVPVA